MTLNNAAKRGNYGCIWACAVVMIVWLGRCSETSAFQVRFTHRPISIENCRSKWTVTCATGRSRHTVQRSSSKQDETDQLNPNAPMKSLDDDTNSETVMLTPTISAAKTGTVNERLIAELQQATALEKSGVGSTSARNGKSNRFTKAASFFKSSKTDEERRTAIAEAQNLNGVNPITTLLGALFALVCAVGLWYVTQSLASYFALHPSDSDIYFVERVTLLSRNVIMGLSALASGFFGVTGIGILLLAIRVGYGVVTGELDPTPIASNPSSKTADDSTKVDMSNVWDMMMNKSSKKGQR